MKTNEKFKFEKLFVVIFLLSLIAVVFEEHILKTIVTVDVHQDFNRFLYDDNTIGGVTQTSELLSSSHLQWQCTLKKEKIAYPFCGLEFALGDTLSQGMDLREFSELKVWLDYEGPANTVRISLKNYNPAYSSPDDTLSLKYNDLDIQKQHLEDGIVIKMASFSVPSWWILQEKVPPHLSAPEFNNVVLIDVQTGSDVTSGTHKFNFKKIEFVGQWMSTEQWYLSILFLWIFFGIITLIAHLHHLREAVKRSKSRELELLVLNNLLDEHSKTLTTQANTDKLTGIFNRQGVEDAISRALVDWQEESTPLSIVMLDIDHFKSINDNFGHAVGDLVLSELAALVQSNIRSTDRFARWGGEEFVLICRNTPLDIAVKIAEKLRKIIAETELVDSVNVTASFGVANIRNKGCIQELFKHADDALYLAKNNGRNKVEFFAHE